MAAADIDSVARGAGIRETLSECNIVFLANTTASPRLKRGCLAVRHSFDWLCGPRVRLAFGGSNFANLLDDMLCHVVRPAAQKGYGCAELEWWLDFSCGEAADGISSAGTPRIFSDHKGATAH